MHKTGRVQSDVVRSVGWLVNSDVPRRQPKIAADHNHLVGEESTRSLARSPAIT